MITMALIMVEQVVTPPFTIEEKCGHEQVPYHGQAVIQSYPLPIVHGGEDHVDLSYTSLTVECQSFFEGIGNIWQPGTICGSNIVTVFDVIEVSPTRAVPALDERRKIVKGRRDENPLS